MPALTRSTPIRRLHELALQVAGPLIVATIVGGCAWAADSATSISRVIHVPADEASLWLLLRGTDRRAPAVLWLHGGPGGAETPLFRLYNRELEKSFVVAYWDQRGAGRSFDPDAEPSRLTVTRHLQDLDRIVDRIGEELDGRPVVLIGHSWGSALGLLYAHRHPGKVSAFVGVGQLVNEQARQRAQIRFARTQAQEQGNQRALREIDAMGEPPLNGERLLELQGWVDRYGGVFHTRPNFAGAVISATLRGYVRPWEMARFIRANNVSVRAMADELASLNLAVSVPAVQMPVLFALGRHDRQVDARLAARYFEDLGAPLKRLVWFENSAHNVPFEEPDRFNAAVRDFLLGNPAVTLQAAANGLSTKRP